MRMSSAIVSTPARQHGGNPQRRACFKKKQMKTARVFHAKFNQPLHCCSFCVCDWLWCGNGSFNAAGGDCGESQSARQTQIFRVPWPRYMWKPLHSRCCRENLLLTGKAPAKLDCTEKEVGGHTDGSCCYLWCSFRFRPLALVRFPPPPILTLGLQYCNVNTFSLSHFPEFSEGYSEQNHPLCLAMQLSK